ncbi:hypothetical protein PHYC_01473 [Phycisphaerales bacterium]|nr:hypothetical protein PHYC_01473 [Phycisphaerales bacterium]
MLIAAIILGNVLERPLLIATYLDEGFSLQQARNAIPARTGDDHVGGVLWPLLVALALTPLSVLRPSLKRAAQAAGLMVGVGVAASALIVWLRTVGR